MKKLLLISSIVLVATGTVLTAEAELDFSVSASPFLPLQGVQFEKEAAEHWQNTKRSEEEAAQNKYGDMDTSDVQKLKQKTQIDLNSTRTPQMIEENGTVKIEYK